MKLIEQRIDFLWTIGLTRPTVRNRRDVAPRKIELIAPEEIAEAICLVVKRAYGIDLDDVSQAVCRLFGFGRTSEDMAAVVNNTAVMLAETGLLVIEDGRVKLRKSTEPDGRPPLRPRDGFRRVRISCSLVRVTEPQRQHPLYLLDFEVLPKTKSCRRLPRL